MLTGLLFICAVVVGAGALHPDEIEWDGPRRVPEQDALSPTPKYIPPKRAPPCLYFPDLYSFAHASDVFQYYVNKAVQTRAQIESHEQTLADLRAELESHESVARAACAAKCEEEIAAALYDEKVYAIIVPSLHPDFVTRSHEYMRAVWQVMAAAAGGEEALLDAGFEMREWEEPWDGVESAEEQEKNAAAVIDLARVVYVVEVSTVWCYAYDTYREAAAAARVAAEVAAMDPRDGKRFETRVRPEILGTLMFYSTPYFQCTVDGEVSIYGSVRSVLVLEGRAGGVESGEGGGDAWDDL